MAIVDIIGFRHGETDGNLANIMQGCSINNDLNQNGRDQATTLAVELNTLITSYDGIYMISSDLLRAKNTGITIYKQLPQDKIRGYSEDLGLRERSYGSFEGRNKLLIRETDGSKRYWSLKTVQERSRVTIANDVETDHALLTRVRAAINKIILARKAIPGKEVLLVSSHGNTLRTLFTAIFNDVDYPPLNNCGYVKFSIEQWDQMIFTE